MSSYCPRNKQNVAGKGSMYDEFSNVELYTTEYTQINTS